jgi:hypothetical protein
MRKLLGTIAAVVLGSTLLAAADTRTPVTITGCVEHGTGFVLTNVHEVTPAGSQPATNVYWLSSDKALKKLVGQQVEVTGTYSLARDAGKTGTVKMKPASSGAEEKVTVERGEKKAEAKAPVSVVGTAGSTKINGPYRRLVVQSVKPIAASCAVQ